MTDEQLADIKRRLDEDVKFPTYPECQSTSLEDVATLYDEVTRLRNELADTQKRLRWVGELPKVLQQIAEALAHMRSIAEDLVDIERSLGDVMAALASTTDARAS